MKKIIISIFSIILFANYAIAADFSAAFSPYELSKNEILFSQSSRAITKIDPTIHNNATGTYFPGVRGTNQLIIYTPEYGEKTNTNEYGTEAIVEGNTVKSLSGADSYIPKNGFVISGHGTAQNWINKNITVGTKVYIDQPNLMLYTYLTSESYLFEAEEKIKEATEMVDFYKRYRSDYKTKVPNEYISEAGEYLKLAKAFPAQIDAYSKKAIESANMAIRTALPYSQYETKAVWVRPTETNHSSINATLDKLKSAGINTVFLETYFHGRTIYPSDVMKSYGFVRQRENFVGFDPLQIWIREAHRRGMKLHVWFETFYVGNAYPQSNAKNILAVHPEWANKNKKFADYNAPTQSVAEHNGYFLDPANPAVQEFLMSLITEIIQEYRPDGINLDYIRYPQAVAKNDTYSWGYTSFARKDFATLHGVDPINIKMDDPLWEVWCEYRREKVTNMVRKVGTLGNKKKVYISTVIFPDRTSALLNKLQDWRVWSLRGYVNGFTPLLLTCDSTVANSMVREVVNSKSAGTELIAGLFVSFMHGSEEDMIRQIYEIRKLGLKGISFFDYAHFTQKYIDTLAMSAFNPNPPVKLTPTPDFKAMWVASENPQQVANAQVKKVENDNKKETKLTEKKKERKGFWFFGRKDNR